MNCQCGNGKGRRPGVSHDKPPWASFANSLQAWAYNHSSEYSFRGRIIILRGNKLFRYSDPILCAVEPLVKDSSSDGACIIYVRLTRRFSANLPVIQTAKDDWRSPTRLEVSSSGAGTWQCAILWLNGLELPFSCATSQSSNTHPEHALLSYMNKRRVIQLDHPFPLLSLPLELRLRVFELATSSSSNINSDDDMIAKVCSLGPCSFCKAERVHIFGRPMAYRNILHISKQIYCEVHRQLQSTLTFRFQDITALGIYLRRTPAGDKSLLRKAAINIGVWVQISTENDGYTTRDRNYTRKWLASYSNALTKLCKQLCQDPHLNLKQLMINVDKEAFLQEHRISLSGWWAFSSSWRENMAKRENTYFKLLLQSAEEFGRQIEERMNMCTVRVQAN